MNTSKHCWNCKETKPVSCFSKQTRSKDGLQSQCKECDKTTREKNKEQRLKYNREYYYNNQEQLLSKKKEYYTNNKEKCLEISKKYQEIHKDKIYKKRKNYFRIKAAERRALKLKATPKWLTQEHKELIKIEYELAAWCSSVMDCEYQVDHIIPLKGKTVCGLHVPWNLQVITAKENQIKNNRIL